MSLLNNYPGLGFASSGGTGVPPDSNGAAGPNSYVETVNQAITIYSPKTTGTAIAKDQLADFYFTQGGLTPVAPAATDAQSDCFVIFDPLVQRFIVGDIDFDTSMKNGGGNALLLAVSKSATPTTLTKSDWFFYSVNTAESTVAIQDYPGDPGYNSTALVVTLNGFDSNSNPVHSQINAISINALITGTPLTVGTNLFQTDNNEFLLRPASMPYATPGDPIWMVAEHGDNTSLDVIRMTNVLSSSPTFTVTNLAVTPYSPAVSPLQPNGQAITSPGFTDSRILNASEANGVLVATHIVSNAAGNLDDARWYAINVASGTPTLQQQGDVSGGPGVYDTYPAIAINSQGQIGMTFMQSGTAPGQFLSVYVTGRTPSDAPGTMETPVLVQAGAGNYVESNAFGNPPEYRLGDVVGISVDADGSFWIANEYANTDADANWGTAIGHFAFGSSITVVLTSAVEGQPLVNVPVATFVDHSGVSVSAYNVTIFWGDGISSAGVVVADGNGVFTVLGSHTYLNAGRYTLTVSVRSTTSNLGSGNGLVTVADAPLLGFAQAINGQVGESPSNVLVAVFEDTDTTPREPSQYTATIQWLVGGLPVTTTGSIVHLFGNTFAVYGSYPFGLPEGGLFTIRVTVTDNVGGASVVVNSALAVAHNPAIPPLVPEYAADADPINSGFVPLEDALTNLLMAERLFFIAFAFGTTAQQQHGFANLVNAFFAYQSAVLTFDMQLPGS